MKKYKLLTICCTVYFSGCSVFLPVTPDDPKYAPVIPDYKSETHGNNGSLFSVSGGLGLYSDVKAHKIGDVITVNLTESMSGKKDAKSNFDKAYTATHVDPVILGTGAKIEVPKDLPLKEHKGLNLQSTVNLASNFAGSGDAEQSNELTGTITVTVTQILPNKHLVVSGEKWVTINRGSEFIRLTGQIRPEDISSENQINSTKIANARITYSGTGDVANSSIAGWMSKFFNSKWFPF